MGSAEFSGEEAMRSSSVRNSSVTMASPMDSTSAGKNRSNSSPPLGCVARSCRKRDGGTEARLHGASATIVWDVAERATDCGGRGLQSDSRRLWTGANSGPVRLAHSVSGGLQDSPNGRWGQVASAADLGGRENSG